MKPVVLFDNLLKSAGTIPMDGEPLIDDDTTSRWEPANAESLEFLSLPVKQLTHIGVAAHNLGSTSGSLLIETGDGTTWTTLTTITSSDNQSVFVPVTVTPADSLRITAQGSGISVGILYAGEALEFERAFYQGHTPIAFSEQNVRTVKNSKGGQYLGNNVKRKAKSTSVSISNLTPQFIRLKLEPFRQHYNNGGRFFFSWNPDKYPDDSVYAKGSGTMSPSNTGPAALMGFGFEITAYINDRTAA